MKLTVTVNGVNSNNKSLTAAIFIAAYDKNHLASGLG